MKLKISLLIGLLCVGWIGAKPVAAAEISVDNVSNKIITCDSPFLKDFPAGSCVGHGPATLALSITTAPNEFKIQCVGQFCAPAYDTYVVAVYKGALYLYGAVSPATDAPIDPACPMRQLGFSMWQLLPADVSTVLPSHSWALPFSALWSSGGKINYTDYTELRFDDTYGGNCSSQMPFADLEIYIGLSPVGQKVFTSDTFKKIWPQP